MTEYRIVACTLEGHGASILNILNEAIVNSTALYDYEPRTAESMTTWFAAKRAGGFPVIGLESTGADGTPEGTLLAFGTYGTFRAWPAYKYTVEHSIYVHVDHRGQGLGAVILHQLIEVAMDAQLHALIGGIDAANVGSIALHEKFGFAHVGTLPEVGYKFGRWLDLAFYQLTLATPANPTDG